MTLEQERQAARDDAVRTLVSALRKVLSPELVTLIEAECRRGIARQAAAVCGNWTPHKDRAQ